MPAALIVGAFGQGNLGDDALLRACASSLEGWELHATAMDESEIPHGVHAVRRRASAVLRTVAAVDAVVFGGGTIFKRLHPASGRKPLALLYSAGALTDAAKSARRQVAMLGVGCGDLQGRAARAIARHVALRSTLLVVRDEESAAQLVDVGVPGPVRVGADLSWHLLAPPLAARTGRGRRVVVIPSRLACGPGGLESMTEPLVIALDVLAEAGLDVEIRSWELPHTIASRAAEGPGAADRDDALAAEIARRCRAVEVRETPATLEEAVETLRSASVVLTFRFHGLVAASAAGTPSVAIAHEHKITGLARRLGQTSVPPDFDGRELAGAVLRTIGAQGPDPALVKQEIARADEGFRLLRVLLGSDQTNESDDLGALPLRAWR